MSICRQCAIGMNNMNVQFCSVECRHGMTEKGSRAKEPVITKYPVMAANIGLKRPYGNHEVVNA